MISIKALEYLKGLAEIQADSISGGILYLFIKNDAVIWRKQSKDFKLNIFNIGDSVSVNGVTARAEKEKRTVIENVPRSLYGMRLRIIAEPMVDDSGEIVGVFSMVFPRIHPVGSAFKDFAPILASMFSEGVFIYTTDLEKIINIQSSKKFDIPELAFEAKFNEDFIAYKAIKEKKVISEKLHESKYGVETLMINSPLFDEETGTVVATLGLAVPKGTAANLRSMSENLDRGLTQVAAAIEELTASASTIHTNEQKLNDEINEIIILSEEINKISSYIKEIADKTKMLGLNAAIECARAGEAGKGFGVVANEIRKLSEQSKSTVPEINRLTDIIKQKVMEASEMSKSSLSSSEEQAAASEEITASVEEISTSAEELNNIAQNL
ncbi:methyl-accepting chemotaxis protein [Clostridium saccharobutylicum]|uniref:Methyl-accepting chemotaxis protein n=1 Tax=Clostridium saccharobutylicum DSM 13864 TaxID=1345695 RepID=U5MUU2_CLOSA|nr:methyl-accepting chemotaxis protein [Clostridium saccharobutylicum]AGX44365.1 methyl-accepting chemotaxis protein [Clostridium saccharobutylicum DSM 13864]AQR91658.1 putative sensory transducer protein YfmS [Clostridium saccharobutylicum]AQS01562.1 putative sensory transducer protein YfmS [Clostridium saccharobutylicum]AQS15545.1 putative sensory transducer protein YfmS [Clostridium saccharobutylicum]MBA2907261.1 hypothetical protein [Clostridium saccharobutylicum]